MKLLSFFIIFFSQSLLAVELPGQVPHPGSSLFQQIRAPFVTKLSDISTNYIARSFSNKIEYSTYKKFQCQDQPDMLAPGTAVFVIKFQLNDQILKIDYFDCTKTLILTEVFQTDFSKSVNIYDYLFGKINYEQFIGNYKVVLYGKDILFKYNVSTHGPDEIQYRLYFNEDLFFQAYYKKETNEQFLKYTFWPIHFFMNLHGHTIRYDAHQELNSLNYYSNELLFPIFKENSQVTSEFRFVKVYSENIQRLTGFSNAFYKEFSDQILPFTEVLQSTGANTRLLDEIKLYRRKLQTGSPADINFVYTQLSELINAIENSEIIIDDRRN